MFLIFGLTVSGFSFGVGQNLCFLDSELIAKSVLVKLTKLGAGEKYVEGLIDYAFSTFENETKSYQSDLVGIDYFHFASEDLKELKKSIFSNASKIEFLIIMTDFKLEKLPLKKDIESKKVLKR